MAQDAAEQEQSQRSHGGVEEDHVVPEQQHHQLLTDVPAAETHGARKGCFMRRAEVDPRIAAPVDDTWKPANYRLTSVTKVPESFIPNLGLLLKVILFYKATSDQNKSQMDFSAV